MISILTLTLVDAGGEEETAEGRQHLEANLLEHTIEEGGHFGEVSLILEEAYTHNAYATQYSETFARTLGGLTMGTDHQRAGGRAS